MKTQSTFSAYDIDLRDGEYLASVMRKHWFVLFMRLLPYKILFILPLLVIFITPATHLSYATVATLIFFSSLWMLVALSVIFTIWTNYFLDIWIVTNQRIIDIEQKNLFNRQIKTLRMETVQDIQTDKVGLFQEFLDFGTLRVQTAGTGGTYAKIVGIPHPNEERDIIMQQVHIINDLHGTPHSGLKTKSPHLT